MAVTYHQTNPNRVRHLTTRERRLVRLIRQLNSTLETVHDMQAAGGFVNYDDESGALPADDLAGMDWALTAFAAMAEGLASVAVMQAARS